MQHLAACRGYEDITLFLIQEGVDINLKGNILIGIRSNGEHFIVLCLHFDDKFAQISSEIRHY